MRTNLAAVLHALQVYAETLPPGTAVPVSREVLLELLAGRAGGMAAPGGPPADLTVADLCARFNRKPSAVRAWLERGDFPGAYKLKGRDWRVPAAAVQVFLAKQGIGEQAAGRAVEGDLSAWRRLRERA